MQFTQNELLLIIIIIILIFYIIHYHFNCSKNIQHKNILNKTICDNGRPKCDIYQTNTINYNKCINDLANYIKFKCNTNQFSSQ